MPEGLAEWMRRPRYYALVEKVAVPLPNDNIFAGEFESTLMWAESLANHSRVVTQTRLLTCEVSTVFLGLDHAHTGPPQIFETMVFWEMGSGPEFQLRYATWEEAEAGHALVCRECVKPRWWWEAIKETTSRTLWEAREALRDAWIDAMGHEPEGFNKISRDLREQTANRPSRFEL